MNDKILREKIITLLANQDDSAALEKVYSLLKPRFEKAKGAKSQKQLVLTDEQRECFDRAVEAGLIERLPDGQLRWLHESKVLLAYFCGRVFCGDFTKTDVDGKRFWKGGRGRFPGAALERLFQVTLLKQSRQQRLMFASPEGHELIDEILLF